MESEAVLLKSALTADGNTRDEWKADFKETFHNEVLCMVALDCSAIYSSSTCL